MPKATEHINTTTADTSAVLDMGTVDAGLISRALECAAIIASIDALLAEADQREGTEPLPNRHGMTAAEWEAECDARQERTGAATLQREARNLMSRRDDLWQSAIATPAATFDGIAAKAALWRDSETGYEPETRDEILRSVARDVLRIKDAAKAGVARLPSLPVVGGSAVDSPISQAITTHRRMWDALDTLPENMPEDEFDAACAAAHQEIVRLIAIEPQTVRDAAAKLQYLIEYAKKAGSSLGGIARGAFKIEQFAAQLATLGGAQSNETDPVFAAIDAHRSAWDSLVTILREQNILEERLPHTSRKWWASVHTPTPPVDCQDDPEWIAVQQRVGAANDAVSETEFALANAKPTTPTGAAALLKYAADFERHTGTLGDYQDDNAPDESQPLSAFVFIAENAAKAIGGAQS